MTQVFAKYQHMAKQPIDIHFTHDKVHEPAISHMGEACDLNKMVQNKPDAEKHRANCGAKVGQFKKDSERASHQHAKILSDRTAQIKHALEMETQRRNVLG